MRCLVCAVMFLVGILKVIKPILTDQNHDYLFLKLFSRMSPRFRCMVTVFALCVISVCSNGQNKEMHNSHVNRKGETSEESVFTDNQIENTNRKDFYHSDEHSEKSVLTDRQKENLDIGDIPLVDVPSVPEHQNQKQEHFDRGPSLKHTEEQIHTFAENIEPEYKQQASPEAIQGQDSNIHHENNGDGSHQEEQHLQYVDDDAKNHAPPVDDIQKPSYSKSESDPPAFHNAANYDPLVAEDDLSEVADLERQDPPEYHDQPEKTDFSNQNTQEDAKYDSSSPDNLRHDPHLNIPNVKDSFPYDHRDDTQHDHPSLEGDIPADNGNDIGFEIPKLEADASDKGENVPIGEAGGGEMPNPDNNPTQYDVPIYDSSIRDGDGTLPEHPSDMVHFDDPVDFYTLDKSKLDRIIRTRVGHNARHVQILYKPDEFGRVRMETYIQTVDENGRHETEYREDFQMHPELVTHKDVLEKELEKDQVNDDETGSVEGPDSTSWQGLNVDGEKSREEPEEELTEEERKSKNRLVSFYFEFSLLAPFLSPSASRITL